MVLVWSILTKPKEYIIVLMIAVALFSIETAVAQSEADSSKIPLLASLEKNEEAGYVAAKSNVAFPVILKGNEAEMLSYIEKFSAEKRDYLTRMYNTGRNILPKAATILKKYDLPEEFAVLLALESEYQGNVVSRSGAVGYWQIMDVMAKNYGIKYHSRFGAAQRTQQRKLKNKVNNNRGIVARSKDDRKNFNIATHTAARYLLDSRKQLDNNWLLVVASYNCGVGKVKKAIRQSGLANPCFWDIKNYLPAQTRAYVMNFITLAVIFNNYSEFAGHKLVFAPEEVILTDQSAENITEAQIENSER